MVTYLCLLPSKLPLAVHYYRGHESASSVNKRSEELDIRITVVVVVVVVVDVAIKNPEVKRQHIILK